MKIPPAASAASAPTDRYYLWLTNLLDGECGQRQPWAIPNIKPMEIVHKKGSCKEPAETVLADEKYSRKTILFK